MSKKMFTCHPAMPKHLQKRVNDRWVIIAEFEDEAEAKHVVDILNSTDNESLFEKEMMRHVIKTLVHHMTVEEDLRALLDVVGVNADNGLPVIDQIAVLKRKSPVDAWIWPWWNV